MQLWIPNRLFGVFMLALACAAHASVDREPPFADLRHAGWRSNDGAPPDIWAIDQSRDGFLWLATGAGLYRFDGARFRRYSLPDRQRFPSNNMTALKILPAGEIWIGYNLSGVSVLKNGRLRNFGDEEGLPKGIVYGFAQDRKGTLWVAVADGLARYVEGRWQRIGARQGYSAFDARWVLADQRGNVWATAEDSVFKLQPGADVFEHFDVDIPSGAILAEANDGSIWLSDHIGGTRPLTNASGDVLARAERETALAGLKAHRMLFAQDGHLWATDLANGGVGRIQLRAQDTSRGFVLESFTETDGLTTNAAARRSIERPGSCNLHTQPRRHTSPKTYARIPL